MKVVKANKSCVIFISVHAKRYKVNKSDLSQPLLLFPFSYPSNLRDILRIHASKCNLNV